MSGFVAFCRAHGIVIDHEPPLGQWRRFKTVDKPSHRNGAVKFMGDYGFVQNHATDTEVSVWHANGGVTKVADQREIAALRKREAMQRVQAMRAMREHFYKLPQLRSGHPYLERKGLSMLGCGRLRVDGDLLVVPMLDADDRLLSYQTIAPDGDKKFRFGCPVQGARYELRRKHAVVWCWAEGLATGLAVYQAIPNSTVVVCFNAGNLVTVAKSARWHGLSVVLADNDAETEKRIGTNPGLTKGREAAALLGCDIAYPSQINGTDWADLLVERGPERGPPEIRMHVMRYARVPERSG